MTLFKPGSPATQESGQKAPEFVVRSWMEVLRVLDRNPGIGISDLVRNLPTLKHSHPIGIRYYVQCMADFGLVRIFQDGNQIRLYMNGAELSSIIREYSTFKQMLDRKRELARQHQNDRTRDALHQYLQDDEGVDEDL